MMRCLQPAALKRVCKSIRIVFWLVFCCLIAKGAEAADDLEELLGNFEETDINISPVSSKAPSSASFHADIFSGYAKLFAANNVTSTQTEPGKTDWQGLTSLRLETMLEVEYRLADWDFFGSIRGYYDFAYTIEGRDQFTSEVLDSYEKELELRELYFQGSFSDNIDIKIGRQIVVWGRSDNIRVTDILNPLDNRDRGITDIENIRLPLTMVKLDTYIGDWNLDLLTILEHRYNKNPVYGHFFYPGNEPGPIDKEPATTFENCEIGLELSRIFEGWDFSLFAAHLYNDKGTFTSIEPLTMEHEKMTMTGASLGYARGSMLYIAELAHFNGLQFMTSDQDYSRTDFLVGIEYSGFTDTTINLDYAHRHLHNYDSVLDASPENPKETENEMALRITRGFFNERLELTALFMLSSYQTHYMSTQRLSAIYEIVDNWNVTAGVLLYQGNDGQIAASGDIGRVYGELRYDF